MVKRSMLAVSACLFGVGANAQYSATFEQYPTSDYSASYLELTLTEVATALETDTATLNAYLNDLYDNDEEGLLKIKNSDGTYTTEYTGNTGEFWLDENGEVASWGDGSTWFVGSMWGSESDYYYIYAGQYPEACSGGESYSVTLALDYGDNEVTFDITLNVKELDVPDPETLLLSELDSKMTLVGSQDIACERDESQGYTADAIEVDFSGVAELLGTDDTVLSQALSALIYTRDRDDELGTISDTLTNESTATSPGWWFETTIYGSDAGDDLVGLESPELASSDYSSTSVIFMESFAYDEDSEVLSANLGQYPGVPNAGDEYIIRVYIIYGDKYYQVNYTVSIVEAETQSLSEMTSVGSYELDLEFNDQMTDYQTIEFYPDLDAIAEALGCETSEIDLKPLAEEGELYTGSGTANNGGSYLDEDGYVISWGSSSIWFYEPTTSGDYSELEFGLYYQLQVDNVGETYEGSLYFVYGTYYYELKVNISIVHKELESQDDWTIVTTKRAAKQVIISDEDYIEDDNQTSFTITTDQCYELIGTTDPMLYCLYNDSIQLADDQIYAPYTKYPCDPTPGVWLDADGRGASWSGSEDVPVGICWDSDDGEFDVYQVPGVFDAGDEYSANLYLVNEETDEMIEIVFNIAFVSEIVSADEVGSEDITLPVSIEFIETTIDLSDAADALGVTVDDLMSEDNEYLVGQLGSGLYSEGTTADNGLIFATDGSYDEYGTISIEFSVNDDGTISIWTFAVEEIEAPFTISAVFGFEIDNSVYVFNVTFVDVDTYDTGITTISADETKSSGKIYDLSGRQVTNPQKGIYIQDGKKFIAK